MANMGVAAATLRRLCALLLLAGLFAQAILATPLADAGDIDAKKPIKCAKGAHIIAVRGHPKKANKPQQGFGITLPLAQAIAGAIPHTTNETISYPKSGSLKDENQAATTSEQAAIARYAKACPKTPIVLMGYSEGAIITMNTICGTSSLALGHSDPLDPKYTANIMAVISYSDGTHVPGQSYDLGTCKLSGTYPRLRPAACDPYAAVIQSYCNKLDNFCCGVGQERPYHYGYFDEYDKDVAKFVKKQFKKFKNGQ